MGRDTAQYGGWESDTPRALAARYMAGPPCIDREASRTASLRYGGEGIVGAVYAHVFRVGRAALCSPHGAGCVCEAFVVRTCV